MARRKNVLHHEQVRERIQTTQLIKRLYDNALGKIKLEQTQVKSIEILLKKCIPDLANIQLSGDKDNPIDHTVTIFSGVPRWKSGQATSQENNSSPSTQGSKDGQP